MEPRKTKESISVHLTTASGGKGALLQRDYWTVIANCRCRPSEVMDLVKFRFEDFSPREYASFERVGSAPKPLTVGDDMYVHIRFAGRFGVRVVHEDRCSLTLRTHEHHPEAGRITFGSYRNERGDVIFHIRSRARSSSHKNLIGFFALGEPMQTNTWSEFVNTVALTVGDGPVGFIFAESTKCEDTPADDGMLNEPTFTGTGD